MYKEFLTHFNYLWIGRVPNNKAKITIVLCMCLLFFSCKSERKQISIYPFTFDIYDNLDTVRTVCKKEGVNLGFEDSNGSEYGGNTFQDYVRRFDMVYFISCYFISNELNGVRIEIFNEKQIDNTLLNMKIQKLIMPSFRNKLGITNTLVVDTIEASSKADNKYIFFVRTHSLDNKLKKNGINTL